jgi:hypothetical protein
MERSHYITMFEDALQASTFGVKDFGLGIWVGIAKFTWNRNSYGRKD